jgi:hypothetical protein
MMVSAKAVQMTGLKIGVVAVSVVAIVWLSCFENRSRNLLQERPDYHSSADQDRTSQPGIL